MKIHVFGRIFKDILIYGDAVHSSEIYEDAGGSCFNAALALSILGIDTYIHSSYGKDHNGVFIKKKIDGSKIRLDYLQESAIETNVFISKNNSPVAVKAYDSNDDINMDFEISEDDNCLVFATEIQEELLEKIINRNWNNIFVDIGPKYQQKLFPYRKKNMIIIGNITEASKNDCDVIKRGPDGASWNKHQISGNKRLLPYTIGSGDLFDAVLIYSYFLNMEKEKLLKKSVDMAQKACMIPGSSQKSKVLTGFVIN
jgi:sugar/nucleoside kinase (ribokinase family)